MSEVGEGEQKIKQLVGNVMFALQDAGVLEKNEVDILPKLEGVTEFMKGAILASDQNTKLYFVDNQRVVQDSVRFADIARDENGKPLFTSTIGVEPYRGDMHEYALFTWKTKDGKEYQACYPNMAFYIR